jgi:hypothetical protein
VKRRLQQGARRIAWPSGFAQRVEQWGSGIVLGEGLLYGGPPDGGVFS